MIIRLQVFEQTLSIIDTRAIPRKGSKDYLVLQFLFSSDWKDLNKVCYLQRSEVSQPIDVVENLVEVPEWFTQQDSFDVTLFGKSSTQEVPTNVVSLRLEKSNTLWEQICETHDGTKYDPIPYDGNMTLESGKYYTQSGMTYLCSRDTVNPVYNALSELVGIYVEVVNG